MRISIIVSLYADLPSPDTFLLGEDNFGNKVNVYFVFW